MSRQSLPLQLRVSAGFTLIELVLVIIILSIAAVPILGMFGQVGSSLVSNEQLQTGTQLAQEKVEQLLALRRINGYSDTGLAVGATTETLTGSFAGYSRITTISDHTGISGCPTSTPGSCKQIQVQVEKGGATLSTLYTMVADY
jgi:prepilin-type N-terminal cleavage/methylation domain-containing protein